MPVFFDLDYLSFAALLAIGWVTFDGWGNNNPAPTSGAVALRYAFDFTNSGTRILIGAAHANSVVSDIAVRIITAFDAGVGITVGTLAVPDLFMLATENWPTYGGDNTYWKIINEYCAVDTPIYLTISVPSSSGTGEIVVSNT